MGNLLYTISALIWLGTAAAQTPLETGWSDILQRNVSPGQIEDVKVNTVDYAAIKEDPAFASLVELLKSSDPASLAAKNEKLAFWINGYNIAAVKMVIDHYPVKSIRQIGGLLSPVWKKKAIEVGGRDYSLNDIEHEILRTMGEPRIHFAIVCASVSCPDLRPEAFSADSLEAQLEDQTRRFLANPQKGARIDKDKKSVYLSSIFKWFKEDFGDLSDFVDDRLGTDLSGYDIKFLDYNWNLNGLAGTQ